MALYKEQFGSSYTYDSNGNVISAKDKAKQEPSFTYNGSNDLPVLTDPRGRSFTYTYDSKHNVTGAQSAADVKYSFTYDAYGNPLTGKVQDINDSSKKILASAAYETDNSIKGKYMESLTDPFGKVITYVHQSPGGDKEPRDPDLGSEQRAADKGEIR